MKCCNCKNLTHLYEDGEPYDWCEEVIDSPCIDRERDCKHYEAATNGDKIRRMTDESLARYIQSVQANAFNLCLMDERPMRVEQWLDYLETVDET